MPDFLRWVADHWEQLAAVTAALGGLWWAVRTLHPIICRVRDFLDDWAGEPARPGVDARAGVMERMDAIEEQLQPNGGGSARDAIDRIGKAVDLLGQRLDAVERVVVPDQGPRRHRWWV